MVKGLPQLLGSTRPSLHAQITYGQITFFPDIVFSSRTF